MSAFSDEPVRAAGEGLGSLLRAATRGVAVGEGRDSRSSSFTVPRCWDEAGGGGGATATSPGLENGCAGTGPLGVTFVSVVVVVVVVLVCCSSSIPSCRRM